MKNKKKIVLGIIVLVIVILTIALLYYFSNINNSETSLQYENIDLDKDISIDDTLLDEYDLLSSYDPSAIKIELNQNNSFCDSDNVTINNNVITISKAGTYEMVGNLTDGNVIVDVDKESFVRIILNNISISTSNTSPIFVKSAKKVVVTLNDGSNNSISDTSNYVLDENEEPDATLYSKDDLTINGKGNLSISSNYNDAIICKDSLKILNSNIEINSVDDGIKGKDLLYIKDAIINVNSSSDAIKSTNDTDTTLGNLYINNSTLDLTSKQDGIQSENILTILNSNIKITTGDGSSTTLKNTSNNVRGFINQNTSTNASNDNSTSMKGIKAKNEINIESGTYNIDSQDDSIHSNGNIIINSR